MTLQTPAPIEHTNLSPTARTAGSLVRDLESGQLDVDPPYQRGEVWTIDQRRDLVRSWLTGLPAGVVVLSDRANENWRRATENVYSTGAAIWAVVDGKQRILAAQAWVNGELAVPASWFDDELVAETEETDDGRYLRFTGLTVPGQRKIELRSQLQVVEFRTAATVADEALMYLLVNGGGTPQTGADMANAARTAER